MFWMMQRPHDISIAVAFFLLPPLRPVRREAHLMLDNRNKGGSLHQGRLPHANLAYYDLEGLEY